MSVPCPASLLPPTTPPPSNHLVWAVLVTLFCCLPGGIVAIVKGADVNSLWIAGHYDAARRASESAKNWCLWSTIFGIVTTGISFLLGVLGFLASAI